LGASSITENESGEIINLDEVDEDTSSTPAQPSQYNCDLTSEEINIFA